MQRLETRGPAPGGNRDGAGEALEADSRAHDSKQPETPQPTSPGTLRVRPIGTRYFEVVEPPDGLDAHHCEVLDAFGLRIDRVAWLPGNPGRWRLEKGLSAFLNEAEIDECLMFAKPLVLHSTPMAWQQAGGEGAVIIDWENPGLVFDKLIGLKAIGVDCDELGRRIYKALHDARRPVGYPTIHVKRAKRVAA